ncbi:hypothetical protein [Mesorhizobium carmichaelinearum]|uniref:hypothetical protein n=1 Tax=Mesorhizobium carmichaelinearum TaxID=1208188 RepID=UPI000BA3B8AB|nr:hypothetical protein [Mesorhizobium carmichaelinearum]
MHFDVNIVLALIRTLAAVEIGGDQLARFDALIEYGRGRGVSLFEASKATGLPLTYQTLVIVTLGYFNNWSDGGDEAALTLPEPDTFEAEVAADEAPERELVKQVVFATRHLAWVDIGDRPKLHQAGKTLIAIMQELLKLKEDHIELAISLCLLSRDILERFDDPDARLAQLYAYRMLVLPRRLPFLPDLPPAKYPPPLAPEFEEKVLLPLCLDFIQKGLLDQAIDLGESAAEMLADPESVVNNQVQVQIGDQVHALKFELAFSANLIRWAFNADDEWGPEIGPNERLRVMLSILCDNRNILEGFRDDDYGFVYEVIYLGFDDSPDRLSLALKIESFAKVIRIVVGLKAAEVRVNNARDHIFSKRKGVLLEQIRALIEART